MVDPWSYAEKTDTEHAHQVALFMWSTMACNFGEIIANSPNAYNIKLWAKEMFEIHNPKPISELKWLHAVHNQGHGDKIRGAQAKAEGVKAGVADIFLPVPKTYYVSGEVYYCGLYIELKKKNGGVASEIQLEFQNDMIEAGYCCEVIHGWELARDEILRYLGRS